MHILDLNGEKLKAARERLGLSREKLSEKSGLPVRTIQDIEQGVTANPGLKNIQSLVKALELEIDFRTDYREPKTVGEMTPQELAKLLGVPAREPSVSDEEFARLRALDAHLRQYGDDFVEALSKLDEEDAMLFRLSLRLPELHDSKADPKSFAPASSETRKASQPNQAKKNSAS